MHLVVQKTVIKKGTFVCTNIEWSLKNLHMKKLVQKILYQKEDIHKHSDTHIGYLWKHSQKLASVIASSFSEN